MIRPSWPRWSFTRRSPGTPLPALLVTALVQNTFSVGYNLYMGLAPLNRPAHEREVLLWMALTAVAFVVATGCIPLIEALQRRGLMRKAGWTSWSAFYLIVLLTCLAGGLFRALAGRAILPELPAPVLATDMAFSVGGNMFLMLVTAEWYRGHLDRLEADAMRRERFGAELMLTQQGLVKAEDRLRQGLAELLHGPVQSHLFLAWMRLRGAQMTPAERPEALEEARQLLADVRSVVLGRVRDALSGTPPQDSLEAGSAELAASYGAAVPIDLEWSPEAPALARRLAPTAQAILLQLEEECLLNALRHASPKRIRVSVTVAGQDTLRLAVTDNGKGFSKHASPSGLGLKMLGRKLEEQGGSWSIHSVPGAGTEVTMEVSPTRMLA